MAENSGVLIKQKKVMHFYRTGAPRGAVKNKEGVCMVAVPVVYRPVQEKRCKYTCKKLREIRKTRRR